MLEINLMMVEIGKHPDREYLRINIFRFRRTQFDKINQNLQY